MKHDEMVRPQDEVAKISIGTRSPVSERPESFHVVIDVSGYHQVFALELVSSAYVIS